MGKDNSRPYQIKFYLDKVTVHFLQQDLHKSYLLQNVRSLNRIGSIFYFQLKY